MTFEEYLLWLDEYWEIFGPPTPKVHNPNVYRNLKL